MDNQWEWLVGKEFSLGTVKSISGDKAIMEEGAAETELPIAELIEEDYISREK